MPSNDTRIGALDGLRFVAAFSVMVSHLVLFHALRTGGLKWGEMSFSTWNVLHLANFGMTLFFVLSGFVIHLNYRDIVRNPGGLKRFFLARWSRLYPLFFLVFVLGLVHIVARDGFSLSLLPPLPLFLTFTQSWWFWPIGQDHAVTAYADPAIAVMWSLSTEAFFYCSYPLLAPLICRLRRNGAMLAMALVACAAVAACLFILFRRGEILTLVTPVLAGVDGDQFIQWLGYNSPWIRMFEFLSGALAAQLFLCGFRLRAVHADMLMTVCLLGILAMFVSMFASGSPFGMTDTTAIAPCFAGLCVAATARNSLCSRLLNWPPMLWGGEASYSLYLLHAWVLSILAYHRFGLYGPVAPIGWYLVCPVAAVLISRVSFVLYERPAMRYVRNRGIQLLDRRAKTAVV